MSKKKRLKDRGFANYLLWLVVDSTLCQAPTDLLHEASRTEANVRAFTNPCTADWGLFRVYQPFTFTKPYSKSMLWRKFPKYDIDG